MNSAPTQVIKLAQDGSACWAGMGNFELITPNGKNRLEINYVGEPPHGDSYHSAVLNGKQIPGYVWGCMFGCDENSKYIVCSWMQSKFERKTIVISCEEYKYFVLPEYIYSFSVKWPEIVGKNGGSENVTYMFTGNEQWVSIET